MECMSDHEDRHLLEEQSQNTDSEIIEDSDCEQQREQVEQLEQEEQEMESADSDIIEESDYEGETHPKYLQWENSEEPNLEQNEGDRTDHIDLEPDFHHDEEEEDEDEVEVIKDIKGIQLEEQVEDYQEVDEQQKGSPSSARNVPEHILNSSLELEDGSESDSSIQSEISVRERHLMRDTDIEPGNQLEQLRHLDLETNSESDSQSECDLQLAIQSKQGRHLDLESGSDSDNAELRYLQRLRETIRHRSRKLSRSSQSSRSSRSSRPGTSTQHYREADIQLGNDGDSEGRSTSI